MLKKLLVLVLTLAAGAYIYCAMQKPRPATESAAPTADGTKTSAAVLEVSDATFEQEVLLSKVPVLVDFWAPWCGPCRAMSPVVEEFAEEMDGRVKVVKVNTDESPHLTGTYSIRGIPSLYLFKNGRVVEQIVGALPKSTLSDAFGKHL